MRQGEMAPSKISAGKGKEINISVVTTNGGVQYGLVPETGRVSITSEQFPGWLTEVTKKQSLSIGFDYSQRRIDIETADLNSAAISMTFSDGARVELLGGAKGRLEVMTDGSYAFFGSGQISGTSADGTPVRFGYVFPPLFGGKLIAPKSTNANERFARATPVTQVTFVGQLDSGLHVQVGEQMFSLPPGEMKKVTSQNGGQVSLLYDAASRSVDWSVQRGFFRFTADSFSCWKALGTSGQKASMQWDTNGVMMLIKNKNGPEAFAPTLLINLNPVLNVAVGESATFQYGRTGDCSTFIASANGGETTLYNALTGRYVRLDEGNMNIIAGSSEQFASEMLNIPATKVRLGWKEKEREIELLRGIGEPLRIPIGGEGSVDAGPDGVLNITYSGNDLVGLVSRGGNFSVTPEVLPNVFFTISDGAGVTIGYNPGAEILVLHILASNLSPVSVRTPTGFYPAVPPGTKLTFIVNRSAFEWDDEGTLIFTETAGSTQISGGLGTPPLLTGRGGFISIGGVNPNLNQPRIIQPPATTLE